MRINFKTVLGAAAMVGIGYLIGKSIQGSSNDTVHKAVKEMVDDGTIDVSKEKINRIIDDEVRDEINIVARSKIQDACDDATELVRDDIKAEIRGAARRAVNETYKNMESSAKDQIQRAINGVDITVLKNEIRDETSKNIAKQMKEGMNDILDQYKDNLKNVKSFYNSMEEAFRKNC